MIKSEEKTVDLSGAAYSETILSKKRTKLNYIALHFHDAVAKDTNVYLKSKEGNKYKLYTNSDTTQDIVLILDIDLNYDDGIEISISQVATSVDIKWVGDEQI